MFCCARGGAFFAEIQRCPVCDVPLVADPPGDVLDRILSEEEQVLPLAATRP